MRGLVKHDFVIQSVFAFGHIALRYDRQQRVFVEISIVGIMDFIKPLVRFICVSIHRNMVLVALVLNFERNFASRNPSCPPIIVHLISQYFATLKSCIGHITSIGATFWCRSWIGYYAKCTNHKKRKTETTVHQ